ncbi:MAG: ABC transporter substrate-binding protein, partial [Acidimicrobiales bacterium]
MINRLGRTRLLAVVAGCSALVAACGSTASSKSSNTTTGSGGGAASAKLDPAAVAQLPAKFKASKVIHVAADASYSPNEFFASDNKTIIGMDVDLGHALGQALGVTFTFQNEKFDSILGSLGTRFDLGISSFTDTKAREQQVDMVDYFSAGTSFMVAAGKNQGLTSLEALCGKSVAVETGTTQLDDASAQSKKCTASGQPGVAVNSFPDQNGANLALSSGRAQLVMADSPVAAYAVKKANGQFKT